MDTVKKIWALSFKDKPSVGKLILYVIIWIVVGFALGIILPLLAKIPVVGIVFTILSYLVDIYVTAGIVFTFLNFFKVGPFKS